MAKKWEERVGRGYNDRLPETIIQVGRDQFTRFQLVTKAKNGNFPACMRLDQVIQTFQPKSVRGLARRINQFDLRAHDRIGDTAIYVFCRILRSKGYTHAQVNKWLDKGLEEKPKKMKKKKR